MLKVMLIDDEPYILQGLQVLVNWESEGYEIAAVMTNGKDAYNYLKENQVDLIISDIQMPKFTEDGDAWVARYERERLVELAAENAHIVLTRDKEKIRMEQAHTTGAVKNLADMLGLEGIRRNKSRYHPVEWRKKYSVLIIA